MEDKKVLTTPRFNLCDSITFKWLLAVDSYTWNVRLYLTHPKKSKVINQEGPKED